MTGGFERKPGASSNLSTSAEPPRGGYRVWSGATVTGVGRPLIIDFEDGHDYVTHQVASELQFTSPDEIIKRAEYKGSDKSKAKARVVACSTDLIR